MLILALGPSKHKKSKLSESQRHLVNWMSVKSFAALTLFAGLLLILSASLPEALERTQLLNHVFSLSFIKFSKLSTMGIGLLLIIFLFQKGIWDKLKSLFYYLTHVERWGVYWHFLKG